MDIWVVYDVYNVKNAAVNILIYHDIFVVFSSLLSFKFIPKSRMMCEIKLFQAIEAHYQVGFRRRAPSYPPGVCSLGKQLMFAPSETRWRHPSEHALPVPSSLWQSGVWQGLCLSLIKQIELSSR